MEKQFIKERIDEKITELKNYLDELSKSLQDAKGMRNIIAHEYGKVNDETVFDAISSELEEDTDEFLENIKKILEIQNNGR